MLGWIIHKDKPQGWQSEHILACYLYGGSKLEEPKRCYFMYHGVLKRTKSGNLKIRIYGERWKKVTGKPRIKYLKLEDQNRVKTYKNYYKD